MHENLAGSETNDGLQHELRRENVTAVLDTIQEIIDTDPDRICADTSLRDYGLPADIPTEDRNRFSSQYRTILNMLQQNWWESRQNPNTMPEIASVRINTSQMDGAEHCEAMYMTVYATSIDGSVSRYATASWEDEGLVKIYDLFLDENGHTSAIYNIDLPDDGLYQRLMGSLSDKESRTLLEYIYHGTMPLDALDTVLGYIRNHLREVMDAEEAEQQIDQLRNHSVNAHGAMDLFKLAEADAEMSDMDLIDLHETLRRQRS